MDNKESQSPLVSITLPLAQDADPYLLKICLNSISAQTYPAYEVLVLISDDSIPDLQQITESFPFVKIFKGTYNKSTARNFLISKSNGKFILILDVDNELPKTLLEKCLERALKSGSEAIIAPNREAPSTSFWRRCRSLEWELLAMDPVAETPNFIGKSLLEDIGGFDPFLDPLDDWDLNLAIRSRNIPFEWVDTFILVHSSSSIRVMIHRKYLRGRLIPALESKYPDAPQLRFVSRAFQSYLRNWKLLLRSPTLTLGLGFLKVMDLMALSLGRMNPLRNPLKDGTQPYFQPQVARNYETIRLGDNFNRYKHYAEIQSIVKLLPQPGGPLLEVGCGTGRITDDLTAKGYRITSIDPSPAMLVHYSEKRGLPTPIQASGTALPFTETSFEGAYSLRVIWHLPNPILMEQFIGEMGRVALQYIILDIANANRWRHPLLRPIAAIYFRLRPYERRVHETSQLLTLDEFTHLAESQGLQIQRIMPLDVLSPIWLKLLPSSIARILYPTILYLESALCRLIAPGRFLIRLAKPSSINI